MIQRYFIDTSCECGRIGDSDCEHKDNEGSWVRYEDYELEKEELHKNMKKTEDQIDKLCAAIMGVVGALEKNGGHEKSIEMLCAIVKDTHRSNS